MGVYLSDYSLLCRDRSSEIQHISLNIFLDADGLLRVGGHQQNIGCLLHAGPLLTSPNSISTQSIYVSFMLVLYSSHQTPHPHRTFGSPSCWASTHLTELHIHTEHLRLLHAGPLLISPNSSSTQNIYVSFMLVLYSSHQTPHSHRTFGSPSCWSSTHLTKLHIHTEHLGLLHAGPLLISPNSISTQSIWVSFMLVLYFTSPNSISTQSILHLLHAGPLLISPKLLIQRQHIWTFAATASDVKLFLAFLADSQMFFCYFCSHRNLFEW